MQPGDLGNMTLAASLSEARWGALQAAAEIVTSQGQAPCAVGSGVMTQHLADQLGLEEVTTPWILLGFSFKGGWLDPK